MKKEIVNPNLGNFINSMRDVGYTFEIAVADILDNSLDAGATEIKITALPEPEPVFYILDNGKGMDEEELVEAMRLASKNPGTARDKNELGKFGLGLKTASFSQCRKLTVITKKNKEINVRSWDLDYIAASDEWALLQPDIFLYENLEYYRELEKSRSGTLVIWENIDRYEKKEMPGLIYSLRNHLSLVFHRFIEGIRGRKKVQISVNADMLEYFDPFNLSCAATQEMPEEKIKYRKEIIRIQPYILPHHSKVSQQEYQAYATEGGYTDSQGFYFYRSNRLLIYGTWLGLHKSSDAHKLVRIKIDIPNSQDSSWGIDIKKSTAKPVADIKDELKRIIASVTEKGSRPYTGRGRKITDRTTTKFWELIPVDGGIRFGINREHPVFQKISEISGEETQKHLKLYLDGLEAYIPVDAIQAKLHQNPHEIKQETALSKEKAAELFLQMKERGVSEEFMEQLKKTEIFREYREVME